jgi:hypothetical protein
MARPGRRFGRHPTHHDSHRRPNSRSRRAAPVAHRRHRLIVRPRPPPGIPQIGTRGVPWPAGVPTGSTASGSGTVNGNPTSLGSVRRNGGNEKHAASCYARRPRAVRSKDSKSARGETPLLFISPWVGLRARGDARDVRILRAVAPRTAGPLYFRAGSALLLQLAFFLPGTLLSALFERRSGSIRHWGPPQA